VDLVCTPADAEIYARLSPANLQMLKMLQSNRPLTVRLDDPRREWVADTLIHNDIEGEISSHAASPI
jgi:hypothetical protein